MNHPSGVPVSLIVHDERSDWSLDERVAGLDQVELGQPIDRDVFFVYHGPTPK